VAADDQLADVDNSIVFLEASRHHGVPMEMMILEKGEHGFPHIARERWESLMARWLACGSWLPDSIAHTSYKQTTCPELLQERDA